MKLNAILIALFATAAYAQNGRPSKADIMALREEMRNAETDEERMAIREKIKLMRPDPRMRGDFGGKDMGRMPPRPEDRAPPLPVDLDAMRAETKKFMESIKDITDIDERKKLVREHKKSMIEKYHAH